MALVQDYFKKTEELKRDYGEKSIVLMQVGAFYEVYGLENKNTGKFEASNISDFSQRCELTVSKKNICVGKRDVVMAGFRDYMIDKYLKKLKSFGYTTAVYSQDEKAAGTTRSLTGVYSPGTFFSTESVELTNNTLCIWLEKIGKNIVVGISNIDIYTGKSFLFEYEQEFTMTPEAYDELEKYMSIYNPSELIVIHNLSSNLVDDILHFTDVKTETRHLLGMEDPTNPHRGKISNCEKQIYQTEVMKKFFGDDFNPLSNPELSQYPIGTQCYCYLLDFIYQHNPDLTRKIQRPIFENCSTRMILANHSLKQLNIIDAGLSGSKGSNSCVLSYLNKCKTPMGKRKFEYTLLHPLTCVDSLNREYDFCQHLTTKEQKEIIDVRDLLSEVKDLEKLSRKIALKRITPADCYQIFHSLGLVEEVFSLIDSDKVASKYIFKETKREISEYAKEIKIFIENILVLEKAGKVSTLTFDDNFIRSGFDADHDKLVEEWCDSYDMLVGIQTYLNSLVEKFEKPKKGKSGKTEFVKIHSTEKMGNSLVCTKRRATILKNELGKQPLNGNGGVDVPYFSKYSGATKKISLTISEMSYETASASNYSLICPEIRKLCSQNITSKNVMIHSLEQIYAKFVRNFFELLEKIEDIVDFIALVDFSFAKSLISYQMNLTKPTIEATKNGDSFVNVKGMRHILIESLLKDETYVTNDIHLDNSQKGVLLYGTNAVGKSSFIKSLGICVIMAQAGFFVPCSEFYFFPFKNIFTRILGNDNLFKGLSSFAVEMTELKTILSMADSNSLILGDELCSGTESNSAISIFLAGIQHLYKENSNFIFATHFHEIVDFEELDDMPLLSLKHLAVSYDQSRDKLVYDRKLRDGPGESMYGLEVCKALHLPREFLEQAHSLRNKYNVKTGSILDWKQSRYNSQKLRGMCEDCGKSFSTEVHHLAHQKDAKENGYIGSFHKNHVANLRALCEKCHLKAHQHNLEVAN